MLIEEKIEKAKIIHLLLEEKIEEFKIARIKELNADYLLPITDKRGLGGVIIADDGTYMVCGSAYPLEYYIEKFKDGKRDDIEKINRRYYKRNDTDLIWWVDNHEKKGEILFTFDKKRIFNLFQDYPQNLSEEEKEIFDKENPYWRDFFTKKN